MIAVLGPRGQLGSGFIRQLGPMASGVGRDELDLSNLGAIPPWLATARPEIVINCAAYTDVDAAETDPATAFRVNSEAVAELARVCGGLGIRLVTFSSDYVFDGTKDGPYLESDPPRPLNVYGMSKARGESHAMALNPASLVIRTSWLLSATHRNFLTAILEKLATGPVQVVDDQRGRPTIVDELVPAVIAAIDNQAIGILHLTNTMTTTWYQLALEIAQLAGHPESRVIPITSDGVGRPARRPRNSALASERIDSFGLAPLLDHRRGLQRLVSQAVGGFTPGSDAYKVR